MLMPPMPMTVFQEEEDGLMPWSELQDALHWLFIKVTTSTSLLKQTLNLTQRNPNLT